MGIEKNKNAVSVGGTSQKKDGVPVILRDFNTIRRNADKCKESYALSWVNGMAHK